MKTISKLNRRRARTHWNRSLGGGARRRSPRGLTVLTVVAAIALVALTAGCTQKADRGPGCTARPEALYASRSFGLIVIVPRTSAETASWGLRYLAHLLPFVARAGLELHVIYTQDGDDLEPDGGDGGPPQKMRTSAPKFSAFRVPGRPEAPADPTHLSAKLYCERLAAWEHRASRVLAAVSAQRIRSVAMWARRRAGKLMALAGMPIPDTYGAETGGEIDANASLFSAVQVAEATPRPTLLLLGGLPTFKPPSLAVRFPIVVAALIRSGPPAQMIRDEFAWRGWVHRSAGRFKALSANDDPAAIARALHEQGDDDEKTTRQ